jgi:hypothetical protein
MKNLALSLLLLLAGMTGMAQNPAYQDAMKKNLARMDSARAADDYRQIATRFEQISGVALKEWLPSYYAALNCLLGSFQEPDAGKKDALLDQAEKMISEGRQRGGDASELLVMESFVAIGRIQVDPMTRGMEYSMKANALLGKARTANPANPRVDYLQGTMVFNTPVEYGGGKEQALPLLKQAKEKYAAYKIPGEFWPDWGKDQVEQMLAQQ